MYQPARTKWLFELAEIVYRVAVLIIERVSNRKKKH